MNRFDVILWDVDGTLLDFLAAEKAAIQSLLKNSGWESVRMRCCPGIRKLIGNIGENWNGERWRSLRSW